MVDLRAMPMRWVECAYPRQRTAVSASDEENAEFVKHIRELYDAGVPLFTKERLREVAWQLKDYEQNKSQPEQKIFVRGIDGKKVEFLIQVGHIRRWDVDKDEELVVYEPIAKESFKFLTASRKSPCVWYINFESLVDRVYATCVDLLYSNVQIYHDMERRRESDKELTNPESTASPQEAELLFRSIQERWEGSETCRQLRSILLASTDTLPPITKIVAFSLSSFSLTSPDEVLEESRSTRRAAYQHSMLLTLKRIISEADSQPPITSITCYVQDPIYTESDTSVLKNHAITVLDDPHGFLEVDESTVVISIASNAPIKEVVTDIARPAIIIWDRPPQEGDHHFGMKL